MGENGVFVNWLSRESEKIHISWLLFSKLNLFPKNKLLQQLERCSNPLLIDWLIPLESLTLKNRCIIVMVLAEQDSQ